MQPLWTLAAKGPTWLGLHQKMGGVDLVRSMHCASGTSGGQYCLVFTPKCPFLSIKDDPLIFLKIIYFFFIVGN